MIFITPIEIYFDCLYIFNIKLNMKIDNSKKK